MQEQTQKEKDIVAKLDPVIFWSSCAISFVAGIVGCVFFGLAAPLCMGVIYGALDVVYDVMCIVGNVYLKAVAESDDVSKSCNAAIALRILGLCVSSAGVGVSALLILSTSAPVALAVFAGIATNLVLGAICQNIVCPKLYEYFAVSYNTEPIKLIDSAMLLTASAAAMLTATILTPVLHTIPILLISIAAFGIIGIGGAYVAQEFFVQKCCPLSQNTNSVPGNVTTTL